MNKYPIMEIANWFLSKEAMTHKKIQKLTYYAEAWSQALYDTGIISDSHFEAWAHGPVSPDLYKHFKQYGWNKIEQVKEAPKVDEEADELLSSVWITYGNKSANELEVLTHSESPWQQARAKNNCQDGDHSTEYILPKDMAAYYRSIYIGD